MDQIRADLAEIKGDIKHGLALQSERLSRLNEDVLSLRERQHDHANRLTTIEALNHKREGAIGSIKTVWVVFTALIGACGAWLGKKLGF